ncbi:MAG TPA: hypothetical protein DCR20_08770 [Planctomycetaceae bacterium]|nr:hypothetical protein [Planctomycetaceae bacterium]
MGIVGELLFWQLAFLLRGVEGSRPPECRSVQANRLFRQKRPMHTSSFVARFFAVAFLSVCLAGCGRDAGSAEVATGGGPAAAAAAPPALVRTQVIREEDVSPEFRATGNVRPRHFSVVASGADGVVAEFPVEVGEFVPAGTLLSKLRMESTDLELQEQEALTEARAAELAELQTPRREDVEESQARVQALQVTASNAQRRLEELRALSRRGAATQSELRDGEDAFDAAQQNLLAAQAAYQRTASGAREEKKQQASSMLESQKKHVDFLKAEREKRLTKAPFDGFVVEEHTYVGQWLSKGAPVLTLARLDEVEVEVQIDQQYIDQVSAGREVTLRVSGSGGAGAATTAEGAREWTGRVAAVVPRSNWERGSRSFPVIIRIQNEIDSSTTPPTPALREGMMAEAAFRGIPVKALLVPKDSVVRTSRGAFVYVVNPAEEGKPLSVRQVLVSLGIGTGVWIQVQGESLAAGQQVVTEGAERLRAFQTVSIMAPAKQAADGGGGAPAGAAPK